MDDDIAGSGPKVALLLSMLDRGPHFVSPSKAPGYLMRNARRAALSLRGPRSAAQGVFPRRPEGPAVSRVRSLPVAGVVQDSLCDMKPHFVSHKSCCGS
jgi:hypothetical protein